MACPNCGAEMLDLFGGNSAAIGAWCPRCGSLAGDKTFTPWLVDRCREFEEAYIDTSHNLLVRTVWQQLGIAESIHILADRGAAGERG